MGSFCQKKGSDPEFAPVHVPVRSWIGWAKSEEAKQSLGNYAILD
jgi:hypothetical protein